MKFSKLKLEGKLKELGFTDVITDINIGKILRAISDVKPTLRCINYNNNNLGSLRPFSQIEKVFPLLVGLRFENNSIKQVAQLDHIKDVPLEIINLNQNPIQQDPTYELFVALRVFFFRCIFSFSHGFVLSFIRTPVPPLQEAACHV